MGQDHYGDLIERIRHRCQQTAWDAQHLELHQRWLVEPEDAYNGWYIPERQSFIALTTGQDGQEPSLAFPPATEQQLVETEQRLGFSLPPLLRLLYAQIANGGFGPGYGIVGASGGFPLMGGVEEDIVQAYQQFYRGRWPAPLTLQASTPICLEEYEMVTWAQWAQAANERSDDELEGETTPPGTPNDKVDSDWEHIYLYDLPAGVWPERLLPLCDWGCSICTHIDASAEHVFQGTAGGQGYILRYVAASLEEWLERWLAGEDLQFL